MLDTQTIPKPSRHAMDLDFAGERFTLLADRAIYWSRRSTLIVADTHFGKDSLFQQRGIPVPSDVTGNDLARLAALLGKTESKRLLILGDFFHGKESNDDHMTRHLRAWRDAMSQIEITLVRGNHDKHAGDPCPSLGFDCLNSLTVDDVKFQHAPNESEENQPVDGPAIVCGHIHPAATLVDFDGTVMKVPAFVVDERQLVVPAFGRFTGTAVMPKQPGRRFMIASHGRIIAAP
jgi:DNA ligase-associated metallophosphoesterase